MTKGGDSYQAKSWTSAASARRGAVTVGKVSQLPVL